MMGWLTRLLRRRVYEPPAAFRDRHYDRAKKVFSLRKLVEVLDQRHTNVSILFLLAHTAMELVSVAFYVWTSEVAAATTVWTFTWNLPVFVVEIALNVVFLLVWVLLFFFEQDRKAYILSWLSIVNAMTSIPMIVVGIGAVHHADWRSAWVPMYLRVWWINDCLTVLIDYPQFARRIPDVWRELVRYAIRVFSVFCTCVGTHQIVEACTGDYMGIYNSVYMMVSAFTTIGYGDVSPQTAITRLFMVAFIIFGLCNFLPLFQRLGSIVERRQFYNTFEGGSSASWLRRYWFHPHVIICGSFSDLSVDMLLRNFYAGWRACLDTRIVLMSPEEHSSETQLTVNLPWLKGRVTLMVGDPANAADLDRAKACEADAIFLFGDARSTAYYQDYTIIAQSMAVSLYDRDLPQHLLLRRNPTVRQISPYAASVLEVERIMHHLLGLSMAQPGVVPLIVNLLRTYEAQPSDTTLSRDWVEQYEYSLRNDMYGLEIPDALRGREFRVLARAFFEKDVTLIGILSVRNVVQLNPRELIPNANKLILIAKTLKVAQDATSAIAREYERTFGEEMLVAPDPDERDSEKRRQQQQHHPHRDWSRISVSENDYEDVFFDGERIAVRRAGVQQQQQQQQQQRGSSPVHSRADTTTGSCTIPALVHTTSTVLHHRPPRPQQEHEQHQQQQWSSSSMKAEVKAGEKPASPRCADFVSPGSVFLLPPGCIPDVEVNSDNDEFADAVPLRSPASKRAPDFVASATASLSASAGATVAVSAPPATTAEPACPLAPPLGSSTFSPRAAFVMPGAVAATPAGLNEGCTSLLHLDDAYELENHFVVIDLSSAKSKDKSSRYAHEAANTAIAHDIFHVIAPVRQAYPDNDVVLLTNDVSFAPYFDYYWSVYRQDSANPVKYISGCGLNAADLRRCSLERCAGCCVFYAGDISRSGSTSAMSMLTVLSINDILQSAPNFPVVVELEGLANLPLFPPHAEDPRLRSKASIDFVYEPNFIIGNAISRLMLFPALQLTYFMEEFIDVMDVLISGHAPNKPALARLPLSLCEAELDTYEDVVGYCLKFGFLPIALQRRIADTHNPSIHGQRFVLTNPPHALPVDQHHDILFYITPG